MTQGKDTKPRSVSVPGSTEGAAVLASMPKYDDIPEEFRNRNSQNKWLRFQRDWFFKGLKIDGLVAKKDVNFDAAIRYLMTIQSSYAPKHEHKEACVAYLASLWFEESSTW